jgi:hypothetical protein
MVSPVQCGTGYIAGRPRSSATRIEALGQSAASRFLRQWRPEPKRLRSECFRWVRRAVTSRAWRASIRRLREAHLKRRRARRNMPAPARETSSARAEPPGTSNACDVDPKGHPSPSMHESWPTQIVAWVVSSNLFQSKILSAPAISAETEGSLVRQGKNFTTYGEIAEKRRVRLLQNPRRFGKEAIRLSPTVNR